MQYIKQMLITAAAVAMTTAAVAEDYDDDYARDRAQIEDLQGRYLFAMNWGDFDTYASTFTEDGVLDWARNTVTGRDAIRQEAGFVPGAHGEPADYANYPCCPTLSPV